MPFPCRGLDRSLSERHIRGMALERHGMCESTFTVLFYSAQIVAAPFQDRLSIAVAKELQTAFGGWKEPPSSKNIA
jgi:hypothetical protein